jgi:hypothetical protein
LDNVSKQLEDLGRSLDLVKDEEGLHTASIEQQVRSIAEIAEELRSFLQKLVTEQQRKAVLKFFHALKSGDKDDKELQGIFTRLDRARDELALRILVAQVGLVGNIKEGFYDAFDVLKETNKKVKEVLGTNLAFIDRLQGRELQHIGTQTRISAARRLIINHRSENTPRRLRYRRSH